MAVSYKKHKQKIRNYKIAFVIIILIILIIILNYQGIIELQSQKVTIQHLNQESEDFIGKEVLIEGSVDQCKSVLKENLIMACLKDLHT